MPAPARQKKPGMSRIVTTHYRYKRPSRKRKAVPLAGQAVVTPKRKRVLLAAEEKKFEPASAVVRKAKPCNDNHPEASTSVDDSPKSAIVTARRPGRPDVPDMTPEEHQRRGDAANALWRELVRRAGGKDRP
jgi:hypothetical protein